jgi:serine/threonine-protein phosphatase 5
LKAKEILAAAPSLVEVSVPEGGQVMVYGDVHGQLFDLLNALTLSGMPSEKNILIFNGDLVDRGSWSVEVIMLVLAMKVTFPQFVHISRGNHEAKSMNKVYGFEGEVKAKYPFKLSFYKIIGILLLLL